MVTTSEKTMFFKSFLRIPIMDILKMSKIKNQITFWKRNIWSLNGLKCVSNRFQNIYGIVVIFKLFFQTRITVSLDIIIFNSLKMADFCFQMFPKIGNRK
jgi:hypothetical protein